MYFFLQNKDPGTKRKKRGSKMCNVQFEIEGKE